MNGLAARYGPWALIAGGSEGVGASFALRLAEAGLSLVLIARREGPLRETARACRAFGAEVRTLTADLADTPTAAAEIARAAAGLEIGLLIYNAGANTHSAEFLDGDLAAFGQVIALNVTTPLALIHHLAAPMRARGRGGVILVGSLAGYLGSARHTVYGGVKAFGRIFAEGLWLELRDHGVDVLELVLGVTRTPAMERLGLDFDAPGLLVSEPDEVALAGLSALGHGPVHVISGHERLAGLHSRADRAQVVLGANRAMRRLMRRPADDG
jgi:short-subunit dehydrogenase